MTDYSELIKKWRDLHRDTRPASAEWLFENQIALYDAAAAIEALQAEVERIQVDVDAVPVVHGHWVTKTVRGDYVPCCSECGRGNGTLYEYDYCPNCGAKMEVQE